MRPVHISMDLHIRQGSAKHHAFVCRPCHDFSEFCDDGVFTSLFGWLQYKFQCQSIGDMAVYFDSSAMSYNPGLGNLRDVQLGAMLAANKKTTRVHHYCRAGHFGIYTLSSVWPVEIQGSKTQTICSG